jgi:hypothetical protein
MFKFIRYWVDVFEGKIIRNNGHDYRLYQFGSYSSCYRCINCGILSKYCKYPIDPLNSQNDYNKFPYMRDYDISCKDYFLKSVLE